MFIPSAADRLLLKFAPDFSKPTYARWVVLTIAAILTTGRRTVTNLLRTVGCLAQGHASSYHRVLSCRKWAKWSVARTLTAFILDTFVDSGPVMLAVDDTVDEHRGKKVYGKGRHRDAVRSTHSYTAFRWGHKWVVLAMLVRFPFATRSWALPILVALYRSPQWSKDHDRRHRTPTALARALVAMLIHWFPERKFHLAGDGGFASHDLARFASRRSDRLTLVSRFHGDANLRNHPPVRVKTSKAGRPQIFGSRLPLPKNVVKKSKRTKLKVKWYGGGNRRVSVVSQIGHWYRGGEGQVEVRWVHVRDLTGTHREEYFFSTDPSMTPQQIIEIYTQRWSIEVTFQDMRSSLGLETTRGRTENTVLRAAPGLFGLYSIVAILYAQLPQSQKRAGRVEWVGKQDVSFSDAIRSVRRSLWQEAIIESPLHAMLFNNLPPRLRETILSAMTPAA